MPRQAAGAPEVQRDPSEAPAWQRRVPSSRSRAHRRRQRFPGRSSARDFSPFDKQCIHLSSHPFDVRACCPCAPDWPAPCLRTRIWERPAPELMSFHLRRGLPIFGCLTARSSSVTPSCWSLLAGPFRHRPCAQVQPHLGVVLFTQTKEDDPWPGQPRSSSRSASASKSTATCRPSSDPGASAGYALFRA
jgi:hypothetical protein